MGFFSKVSSWFEKTGISDVVESVAPVIATVAGGPIGGAAYGLAAGGKPSQVLLSAGLAMGLPELPGDVGKFFGTSAGQGLIQAFVGGDGKIDVSKVPDYLKAFVSGTRKDIIEDILVLVALSKLSDKYAEDAKNRLRAVQDQQTGAINEMMTMARNIYPDDATYEMDVQKNLEEVAGVYENARQTLLHQATIRGMGEQAVPQLAQLGEAEATARLEARRETALGRAGAAERAAGVMGATAALRQPLLSTAEQEYYTRAGTIPALVEGLYQKYQGQDINNYLEQQVVRNEALLSGGAPGAAPGAEAAPTIPTGPIYTTQDTEQPFTVDPVTGEVDYQVTPVPGAEGFEETMAPTMTPVPEGMFEEPARASQPQIIPEVTGDFPTTPGPTVARAATIGETEEERRRRLARSAAPSLV